MVIFFVIAVLRHTQWYVSDMTSSIVCCPEGNWAVLIAVHNIPQAADISYAVFIWHFDGPKYTLSMQSNLTYDISVLKCNTRVHCISLRCVQMSRGYQSDNADFSR